ncbi:MAG: hypothetical protein ACOCP4_00270 [Candidatus Woesearchaeota archaeon]
MKSEKDTKKHNIEYKGIIEKDINEIISEMESFLEEEEFGLFNEKYVKKGSDSFDLEVKLKGKRKVDNYFKYEIKIEIEGENIHFKTMDINGERKRVRRGILRINFSGKTIIDWQNKMSGFWEKLQGFYENMIYGDIKQARDYLDDLLDDYEDHIKQQLGIKTRT